MFAFMSRHPVLTVIILLILTGLAYHLAKD